MPKSPHSASTYRDAGVNIDAGNRLVERLGPMARSTFDSQVLSGLGGFGGLYQLPNNLDEPILVCGADGVGTKLLLARELKQYDTIGIDLVAMCANDILAHGARALLFLDYYACGHLNVEDAAAVVQGIATGCRQAACVLLGGETAEMPRLYSPEDYDLAGFCVGLAEREKLLPRPQIQPGDCIIGIDSSGVHANGFSLVHTILERCDDDTPAERLSRLKTLLQPTVIYEPHLREVLDRDLILGLAHITGGGLTENIPRILPDGMAAHIDTQTWTRPEIFQWLQTQGHIEEAEMRRVFNCGIGMAAIATAQHSEEVLQRIADTGIEARVIGKIIAGDGPAQVLYDDTTP